MVPFNELYTSQDAGLCFITLVLVLRFRREHKELKVVVYSVLLKFCIYSLI